MALTVKKRKERYTLKPARATASFGVKQPTIRVKPQVTRRDQARTIQQQALKLPKGSAERKQLGQRVNAILSGNAPTQVKQYNQDVLNPGGRLGLQTQFLGGFIENQPLRLVSKGLQFAGAKNVGNKLDSLYDTQGTALQPNNNAVGKLARGLGGLAADVPLFAIGAAKNAPKAINVANRFRIRPDAVTVGAKHGTFEAAEQAQDAREAGQSFLQSRLTGAGAGATQAAITTLATDKLLRPFGGSVPGRIVSRTASEATEESLQQLASNKFRQTYNPNQNLLEGVVEAGIYGGLIGGMTSPAFDLAQRPDVRQKVASQAKTLNDSNKLSVRAKQLLRTIADKEDRYNKTTNLTTRRQLDQALAKDYADLREELKKTKGFGLSIAGPLATDFDAQKKAGRVFKGVDDKFRFEIDDSGAKFTNVKEAQKLKTNPKSNKEYKRLMRENKQLIKQFEETGFKDMGIENQIAENDAAIKATLDNQGDSTLTLKDILQHEQLYRNYPQLADMVVEVKNNVGGGAKAAVEPAVWGGWQLTVKPDTDLGTVLHEVQHAIQNKEMFARGGMQQGRGLKGFDEYKRLAGEAEARAVELRKNFSDAERYVIPETKAGDYTGVHEAPTRDGYSAPGHDLTEMFGEDIYSDKAWHYFGHGGDSVAIDKESAKIVNSLRGKPDAGVTIYRAIPKGVKGAINPGDWVTPNKNYALEHGRRFDEGVTILEKKVRADEIFTDGNSIHEFGYDPVAKPRSTFYDSLDVPKEDLIIRDGGGVSNYIRLSDDQDPNVNTGLESLGVAAQKKHGKLANRLTPNQLNQLLRESGKPLVAGREIANKMGRWQNGFVLDETREPLVYGGIPNGVYTDSYVLLQDKNAVRLMDEQIKKKFIKDYNKSIQIKVTDGSFDLAESTKAAEKAYKEKQQQLKDQHPTREAIDGIIGEPGSKAEVVGYEVPEAGNYANAGKTEAFIRSGDEIAVVDAHRLAFMEKHLPDHKILMKSAVDPIQFVKNGKVGGVLMPLKPDSKSIPDVIRNAPQGKQKTSRKTITIPKPQAPVESKTDYGGVTVYRGGNEFDVNAIGSEGIPLTTAESVADYYRGSVTGGVKQTFTLAPDVNIKPVKLGANHTEGDIFKELTKAEKEGFDGIDVGGTEAEIRLVDDSKLVQSQAPVESKTDKIRIKPEASEETIQFEDYTEPEFSGVAASPTSKSGQQLTEAVSVSKVIQSAAERAVEDGVRLDFYAKKDKNGRGIGIETFNPKTQTIESGFVLDRSGNVLGNHIVVDETGIATNVGGQLITMDTIVGNPLDWEGHYKVSDTMDRNLQRNAPNREIYLKTRRFLIDHKTKAESQFRQELQSERKTLRQRSKQVRKLRPAEVSKKEYNADLFDFIEDNLTTVDIEGKYGSEVRDSFTTYKTDTRKLYDDLLDRWNNEAERLGEQTVAKRKDYITHINELLGKPSFAGELYGQLQNSFLGEGRQTTRGEIPAEIAGRTENFAPRKRWNGFFQPRRGGKYSKDPFRAVDAYLEPTLYNIHMTESAVRGRSIEAAFRLASQISNMEAKQLPEELSQALKKYDIGKANSKLVTGIQEYTNALAGKTQRWDRQIIDSSEASRLGLQAWQGLQRVGGSATILGNVQSVLSQTLNQPFIIGDVGVKNYMKGVARGLGSDKAIDKSPFITARRTQVETAFPTKRQKVRKVVGAPLQYVELAFVELGWQAEYEQALANGFKGQEAVLEADRKTERVVAGRGIADRPEVYRSTAANGLLQYTLEVNATNKSFWQDLDAKQKSKAIAAIYGTNLLVGGITGFKPLPDFLDALIDGLFSMFDEEDERSGIEKTTETVKRLAGETVSMNPLATAGLNLALDQEQRKTIFGDESDLGRFEGTSAPIKVIQNAYEAAEAAVDGNVKRARDQLLRILPGGNQARKTIGGLEQVQQGYQTDKNGNIMYLGPETGPEKAQVITFGPYSSQRAGEYFDEDRRPLGEDQSQYIRDLPEDSRENAYLRIIDEREVKSEAKAQGLNAQQTKAELSERLGGTYDDYMEAFKLQDTKRNPRSIAKSMIKGTGYEGLPDNMVDEYIVRHGLKREDIEYAVAADRSTEEKLTEVRGKNKDELLAYLQAGRVKSLDGKYRANDKLLRELYDEGILTNNEYYGLKAIEDGTYKYGSSKTSSGGSSRSGSGGSSRSGSSKSKTISIKSQLNTLEKYRKQADKILISAGKTSAPGIKKTSPTSISNAGKIAIRDIKPKEIKSTFKFA